MPYRFKQKVLFKHCDPAGIVFFPRFLEMLNDAVETMFDEIGWPFAQMHPHQGIPTVALSVTFQAPCRLGEELELALTLTRIGRTSLTLATQATCAGETRFQIEHTVVSVTQGRPSPWPAKVRAQLTEIAK